MSFFSNLFFGRSQPEFNSPIEKDWYDTLIAAGMPSKQAYQNLLEEREIARNEAELPNPFGRPENYWAPQDDKPAGFYGAAWPPGTFAAPPLYGETLLARESADPYTKAYLQKIRSEGVRDPDIVWFWSMSGVDRIMMMHLFTLVVGAFWIGIVERSGDAARAGLTTRKVHPCFGDPDDRPGPPNSPIPVELKHRISIYSGRRRLTDAHRFQVDMENATTFNALVRKEIAVGCL